MAPYGLPILLLIIEEGGNNQQQYRSVKYTDALWIQSTVFRAAQMNEFGDKFSLSLYAGDESYLLSGGEAMLSSAQVHQSWQHH